MAARQGSALRPWRRSRTFGDLYGGRTRPRVTDGIFMRLHSIQAPVAGDELPIVLVDNPSRDMVHPVAPGAAVERVRQLPDAAGITHVWLRRQKPGEFGGRHPFGEFICGSGVRMIVIYAWPKDLTIAYGTRRPSEALLRELAPWTTDLWRTGGRWSLVWTAEAVERWCLEWLVLHEVGHHVDQRRRRWTDANRRQAEHAADSYAARWTSAGRESFGGPSGDRPKL
jgi:hypothetical protein